MKSLAAIPRIDAVPPGAPRPLWSVMIPTFNCANYLRRTLESVLAQDPGQHQMQIEVVDDCSTKDDPEAVVRSIGKGRVHFYRNPQNTGYCTLNFNVCLQRSRGHLVHILHGDDWVLPSFYSVVADAFIRDENVSLVAVRSLITDENGEYEALGPRVESLEVASNIFPPLETGCPFQTPGVTVRRSFYEQHGGFAPSLVHAADWEMWHRATTLGAGLFLNIPLAAYRVSPANDTGTLAAKGEHLRDYLRMAEAVRARGGTYDTENFRRFVCQRARVTALRFKARGDYAAASANREIFKEFSTIPERCMDFMLTALRGIKTRVALGSAFPGK